MLQAAGWTKKIKKKGGILKHEKKSMEISPAYDIDFGISLI